MGEAGRDAATVLVVEPDEDVRDRIGAWLEEDGFEVIGCPGPGTPDYACIGSRSWSCPLEREADIVVLDLCQASDLAMEGTPAEELLAWYVWKGHPVVALRHGRTASPAVDPARVSVLGWPPERDGISGAARGFAGRPEDGPEATAGS